MTGTLRQAFGYQDDALNLPVGDLDEALAFYEQKLGFRVLERRTDPIKSAVLGRDDVRIGLVENGGDPSQDGCAFHVEHLDSLLAELAANGLPKSPSEIGTEEGDEGTLRVFYVVAPDGLCYWFGERQSP